MTDPVSPQPTPGVDEVRALKDPAYAVQQARAKVTVLSSPLPEGPGLRAAIVRGCVVMWMCDHEHADDIDATLCGFTWVNENVHG